MPAGSLKDSLQLPQTDFPMRAQLAQREPAQLAAWAAADIWSAIQGARAGAPPFVLHDGPPYANGAPHHGHLLNKILKDIIVKDRTMAGARPVYQPGWDCHGLPIETQVDKDLGAKKNTLTRAERLAACRAWAEGFVASQGEKFVRLGVFADWTKPYLTMAPGYQAGILRAFAGAFATGLVFRGLRPVHWCTRHQTALAEAEVEYEDKASPSVTLALRVTTASARPAALAALEGPLSLAIWTTTPWSLPGNVAVIVHPELTYVAAPLGDGHVLVAEPCYGQFVASVQQGAQAQGVVPELAAAWPRVLGSELVGLCYQHPLLPKSGRVLADRYVSTDTGTGLVHAAPAHGVDDFAVVTKAGLPVVSLVDAGGRFTADAGAVAGLPIAEGGREIIALLAASGHLLSEPQAHVKHRYAHCWRCHQPIITRATEQWFLALDKPFDGDQTLRARALAALPELTWVPSWGVERIRGMLASRPDWCLSRQRSWGVPLPIAYCESCQTPWAEPKAMLHAADVVAGSDAAAMADLPLEQLFGTAPTCGNCHGKNLRLGSDILDVWFDSGVSWLAADAAGTGAGRPADLYLEGSDQHRGWFHSSLLTSLVLTGKAPYRTCLTHGFVVDGQGKKLAKSKGNFVDPFISIDRDGAEIWRLWVASEDFSQDVRVSPAIMAQLTDHYRKLRNTARYLLGNLHGFRPATDLLPAEQLLPLDVWALGEVAALVASVRPLFAAYLFHQGLQKISEFCQGTLSACYLDALKDRLYASKADSPLRRSAQTALYVIARDVLRLLAPVLSFTAEEAWQQLPAMGQAEASSIHLEYYPSEHEPRALAALKAQASERARAQQPAWQLARQVRRQVMLALEVARQNKQLGSSTEAAARLRFPAANLALAKQLTPAAWAELLIVSQVEISADVEGDSEQAAGEVVHVHIERAPGTKCERCWLQRTDVAAHGAHAAVCQRCRDTLGSSPK